MRIHRREDFATTKSESEILCRNLQFSFFESKTWNIMWSKEGCDIPKLKVEICTAINALFRNEGILFKTSKAHEHLKDQWSGICNIPNVESCQVLKCTAERVCLMPNSEVGCEQSNSKYNRTKDKMGSRMDIEMIRARMRAGSNGPPLHMFNPTPVREYWLRNQHKVAEMIKSRNSDDSRVIKRIRRQDEENYSSRLFLWYR